MLIAAILTAVVAPFGGAGAAVAAPALLETAFRDLPNSVRTGDILKVQVDAPNGAQCNGEISYRDNSIQKLEKQDEADGRCRWDVTVPDLNRRGLAYITVTVRDGDKEAKLTAYVDVVRRADTVGIELKDLPARAKRNGKFTIKLEVPDGSTCSGLVTYADGKTQGLDSQPEYKEQCRWDPTIGGDVERGTARVTITVSQEGRNTTLATSFEVDKDSEDAEVLAAFQDLPGTVRRDGTLPLRVLVPGGASCKGEVQFRSADNAKLEEDHEQNGVCRWSIIVPKETKRGDNDVQVTVKADGDEQTIHAIINVDDSSDDVDASFKDLPTSIKRGDDLEVRVTVPDGSSCQGDVTFDDGVVHQLEPQAEKKERCLWDLKVPTFTPRGVAVVRVWIDDHGVQTTLIGNVQVEGKDSEPVTTAWDPTPGDTKAGDDVAISVTATSGSTCSGAITYANGLRWTLGTTEAQDSRCRWKAPVPQKGAEGKASVEVKIEKSGGSDKLTAEFQVTAP
ncbi:MAG: hypothetical protein AB7P40_03335 [Chloroflexota bacterium]